MTRWIAVSAAVLPAASSRAAGDGGQIGPQDETGAAASNFVTVTDSASR